MKIHHISDHHFGHRNIIQYENRPFIDVEEMNIMMIELWNAVVRPNDIVIHYGDFSLENPEYTIDIIKKLNGDIILIKGNHDRRTRKFWEERAGILKYFKRSIELDDVVLSHRPEEIDKYNIHGHIHSKGKLRNDKYNVCVEPLNYVPIENDFFTRVNPLIPIQISNFVKKIKEK